MDRVAEPTNYEPPRFQTYPQGTQGWVAVHYSATTMYPLSMHLSSNLQSVLLGCSRRLGLPNHPWAVLLCYLSMSGEEGMGGVGCDFCRFLYSWPLASVEKSDCDPSVGGEACITSLLVLVDRAQVKRGRGKLGPDRATPLSPAKGGRGGWCASFCASYWPWSSFC